MDPSPANSAESREGAVSSESCSTRPNPFDDAEVSSRKRRRTSLSAASRSTSVDSVTSSLSEVPTSTDGSGSATMKDGNEPSVPQTPERRAVPSQSTPRSSRVTINVRTPSRPLETIPSSPPASEEDQEDQGPAADMVLDEDVKISVEETEVDMIGSDALESSGSETRSPSVQIINIDDDDAPDYEAGQPQVTLLQGTQDPIAEFPFHEATESLAETVSRLTNFISTHESVAKSVSDWIHNYLAFAKVSDNYTVLQSYQEHRDFWHCIPELVTSILHRRDKATYPRNPLLRREIFEFYGWFARLAAFFLDADVKMLRHTASMPQPRMPDLASPPYMHALAWLTRKTEINYQDPQAQNADPEWSYVNEISEVLVAFQTFHRNQGGSMAYLEKLAQMHMELMGHFPKLCNNLGFISGLMASLTRYSYEVVQDAARYDQQEVEQCKGNIARAWHYFQIMSTALLTIIDKHVNYLSQESAVFQTQSLTEIYRICLEMGRIVPPNEIQQHRSTHHPIPDDCVPEAMSHNWRFTIYSKLIMSSQMQLRVMAASNMCQDLVTSYRKYNDEPEDKRAFLRYLAEFLLRTGLVGYILGPTCHPEITVESSNIVGFLLVSDTYTDEHTDLLWQTITSTQDPRVSDALVKMTARILNLYPYEDLVYLCQKLESLAVEAFSPAIRELCTQIFNHLRQKAGPRPAVDITPYLLCLRLARQSSVFGTRSPLAYPDVMEFSLHSFKELLPYGPGPDGRRRLFEECLQDIGSKSHASIGALAVLTAMWGARTLRRELTQLSAEHDLVRLLIDEFEAAIPVARAAGFPAVLSGWHNAPRREMITVMMYYSEATSLPNDLGHKLWSLLVGSGAACREDRDAGWQILNSRVGRQEGAANPLLNTFTKGFFTEFLPALPSEYFCKGALDFLRAIILPLVDDAKIIVLDEDEGVVRAGIEELWRMILTAPPETIEQQAIHTLVNDIYVESRAITAIPPHRARKVHVAVADRCLKQLSSAASNLRHLSDGTTSEDGSMVIVASAEQVKEQELLFVRSLAVLLELHRLHQAKAQFTVPDLSSLILGPSTEVVGELTELKYQAFGHDLASDIEPLQIGKQNTVGSLLARLREVTGFANYRVYFRGQPFLPQETDATKTLEELQIHEGLMLVKQESDSSASPTPVRPGASPLENEILGHFDELWAFLSLEEKLAKEIYGFLTRLPPDENILRAIQSTDVPHTELFPVGQPFRSLYAVHAVQQYLAAHRRQEETESGFMSEEYPGALRRGLSLIVGAITDADVLDRCSSSELRIKLGSALVESLIRIVKSGATPKDTSRLLDAHLLQRLVDICVSASPTNDSPSRTAHLRLCLQAIFDCCSESEAFWSAFRNHRGVLDLVETSLLFDTRPVVRQHVAKLICESITDTESSLFFYDFADKLIDPAINHAPGAVELFHTCHMILTKLLATAPEALQVDDIFSTLSTRLLEYTTFEDMTQPERVDGVAQGLIKLMHCIITSAVAPITQPKFPREVFWKHLFPRFEYRRRRSVDKPDDTGSGGVQHHRPVLSTESRQMLIDIIFHLVDGSQEQVEWLLEDLNRLVPNYADDADGYAYDLPPQFERSKAVRAPCGYAGLRNLSNTCYLNSLVTQLFMNVSFRRFMLTASVGEAESQPLLFETQKLFAFMQESLQRSVDPENCVANIKTYEDGQIDIHNQMDVDEFYNLLFDRWESQLQTPDAKREFRAFYGGQLVQQVRSKECEHISERLEPFSAIQCDIKGKTCLEESLQAYVDGEIMEGDNKYKCSTCDRHVDAVKRACLKDIPDNLIFHLKRFDFNLRTLQRSKINDRFAFPTQIDMRPYTIEHLSNPADDIGEDLFDLVGVLVHTGTAESGHYYSYVRERPRNNDSEAWVEFNDDTVTSWDPTHLESACFGGTELRNGYDGSLYDKSYSAYMLFYQRASTLKTDQALVQRDHLPIPLRAPIPPDLNKHIQRENVWLLRRHCLYDPTQIPFVIRAIDHVDRVKAGNPESLGNMEDLAVEVGLGHLDQVASRAKDAPDFAGLTRRMEKLMRESSWCSLRVFEYFDHHHNSFRALIQRNPEPSIRSASADLVLLAAREVKQHFRDRYGEASDMEDDDADNDQVLYGMMRLFRLLLDFFHVSIRAWHEVFGFMLDFVKEGPNELATFLKFPYFKFLLQIICADSSLELSPQLARMVTTISRRLPNRPPSYDNLIELVSTVMSAIGNRTNERGELVVVDYPEHRLDGTSDRPPLPPFPLWRHECRILLQDWAAGRKPPNIFLDKLIALDQNPTATHSIVINYMRLGRVFEDKVCWTLKAAITGAATKPPTLKYNEPFLQVGARIYCRHARNATNIQSLIDHVTSACHVLENTEGMAFFEFLRDVFDGPRANSGESEDDILIQGYRNIPVWAPCLLGCYDQSVARQVEIFLHKNLFEPAGRAGTGNSALTKTILKCIRILGCRSLTYVREHYVLPEVNAQRQLVQRFLDVVKKCKDFVSNEQEGEDRNTTEFLKLFRSKSSPHSQTPI
ncbi:hypothetical protein GE09DRAFT_957769 [Coniochaeta sp. 2T2.1]|nr:hypothetical protein GE09DRAFT_957769 [Coniochaeta sp. 2T2.1]